MHDATRNDADTQSRLDDIHRFFTPARDWSFAPLIDNALPLKSAADDDVIIATADALPLKASAHDPWNSISRDLKVDENEETWGELNWKWKIARVTWVFIRICLALLMLYLFICSLDVMQAASQLIGGRTAGSVLSNSVVFNNPVCALMVGVLITVLLQSSSSSSSLIVTMAAAGMLTVQQAIPIIMGTNIGTSVTSTIVSMIKSADRDTFRRAFAGATVHDMFNWLAVLILLPVETITHYLFHITEVMVGGLNPPQDSTNPQFLNVITNPLTEKIIKIDKTVLSAITHDSDRQKFPLPKFYCEEAVASNIEVFANGVNSTFVSIIEARQFTFNLHLSSNSSEDTATFTWDEIIHEDSILCSHLFTGAGTAFGALAELTAGFILMGFSLGSMIGCLIVMVKILNSLMQGPIAELIGRYVNASLPGRAACLTGYLAMLAGAGLTFLVQSSSVFTCTLTPLVGMGIVRVDTMYPLTLGANIGTTFTSLLAAFTAEPEYIRKAVQVSLCHLFFNVSGILLFYPVPFMRGIPIKMAKGMGNTTAKYRWFAGAYILLAFLVMPGVVFALSLAGWYVLLAVALPFIVIAILVATVSCMQNRCMSKLPVKLQTWDWLPLPLRSLEPCDALFTKLCICCKACAKEPETNAFENDYLYIIPDEMTQGDQSFTLEDIVGLTGAATGDRIISVPQYTRTISGNGDHRLTARNSSQHYEFDNEGYWTTSDL